MIRFQADKWAGVNFEFVTCSVFNLASEVAHFIQLDFHRGLNKHEATLDARF